MEPVVESQPPASAFLARGLAAGAVVGLWLGLADGATTVWGAPDFAGPFVDRVGTLAVAMALAAVPGALLGLAWAGLWAAARRRSGGPRRPRPSGTKLWLAAGLALLAGLAIACLGWKGPRGAPGDRPNVLLISIDTLRADHLGAYGYGRDTSPNIDALAAEGACFLAAYSNASWTLTGHASLLTGLDPFAHGVIAHGDKLGARFDTLAERLDDAGYESVAWVGTTAFGLMGAWHGFAQGFSFYRHQPPVRFGSSRIARRAERVARRLFYPWRGSGTAQVDSAIGWLRGQRREPFFLFLHLYDVHSRKWGLPYRAPAPFFDRFCEGELAGYTGCQGGQCASERLLSVATGRLPRPDAVEVEKLRCLYDGAIAYADHEVGRLLAAVDELGLADRTLVVVTADHGEAFFEHGQPLHGTLHEEVTRIPLIVRAPGGAAGKRAYGLVASIDLLPTVLELTGVPAAGPVQGRSFARVVMEWPATASSSVLAATPAASAVSLRQDSFSYIEQTPRAKSFGLGAALLYEHSSDREEAANLADVDAARVEALGRELAERRAASHGLYERIAGNERPARGDLSEPQRRQLRALGYATGGDDE